MTATATATATAAAVAAAAAAAAAATVTAGMVVVGLSRQVFGILIVVEELLIPSISS